MRSTLNYTVAPSATPAKKRSDKIIVLVAEVDEQLKPPSTFPEMACKVQVSSISMSIGNIILIAAVSVRALARVSEKVYAV